PAPSLFRCSGHEPHKEIASTSTGETVEGPVCAEVSVNALRYSAELSKTFSQTPGQNLASVFPASFTGGAGAPPPPLDPNRTPPPTTLEGEFRKHERTLNQLSLQFISLQSG